jgi:hypothetical protein
MAAPASAAGWTNSANVIAADGSYANAAGGIDGEGFPYNSASLIASTFGLSGGAGDTVNGITVQINARRSGAPTGNLVVYLLRNNVPVGSSKSVSLGTGFTTFTLGSAADGWGAGFTGANISQLQVGCYLAPISGSDGAILEAHADWITAEASVSDTTPDAFTFTDVTDATLSTQYVSNHITVAGIGAPAAVSISGAGGEWEKNSSGTWNNGSGTVVNGDIVRVRLTSAPSYGAGMTTILTIGGVSDAYTVTNAAADSTPDAFDFNSQLSAQPSVQYTSNTVTPTGYNTAASVTVSNGGWYKNGVYQGTAAGSVSPGDTVACIGTASASFGGSSVCSLTIGGVAHSFTIQTRAADTTPDAFAFVDASGVALSTVQVSNSVTINGIEAAASVAVTNGEYEINGSGGWTSDPGTINSGQTIRVRHTSSGSLGAAVGTLLTVGGVSDTFTSTTVGADSAPDAFTFTPQTRQLPGRLIESAATTITGINVSVGVTCSAGAEVSIDGGAYSTTGTISNGQTVKVRVRSSVVPGKAVTATVTIGGVSGSFSVTTVRSPQQDI